MNLLTVWILPIINIIACAFLSYKCVKYLNLQTNLNSFYELPTEMRIQSTIVVCILTVANFELLLQLSIMVFHNHQVRLYEAVQGFIMFLIILLGIKIVCFFKNGEKMKILSCL